MTTSEMVRRLCEKKGISMFDYQKHFSRYCADEQLDIRLSFDGESDQYWNDTTYHPMYDYDTVNQTSQDRIAYYYGQDLGYVKEGGPAAMMNSGRYPVYSVNYDAEWNTYEAKKYIGIGGDYKGVFSLDSADLRQWKVTWSKDSDGKDSTDITPLSLDRIANKSQDLLFTRRHSYLYVDNSNPSKPFITGSIDRTPKSGKITVRIIGYYYGIPFSADKTLNVKAVAPKLATKAFDTAGKTETSHDWTFTTTGSKPIKMKAYIDGKTANKLFGSKYSANDQIDITYSDLDDSVVEVFSKDKNSDYTVKSLYLNESGDQLIDNPTRLAFWSDGLTGEGQIGRAHV